jgi:hypothetical protein
MVFSRVKLPSKKLVLSCICVESCEREDVQTFYHEREARRIARRMRKTGEIEFSGYDKERFRLVRAFYRERSPCGVAERCLEREQFLRLFDKDKSPLIITEYRGYVNGTGLLRKVASILF